MEILVSSVSILPCSKLICAEHFIICRKATNHLNPLMVLASLLHPYLESFDNFSLQNAVFRINILFIY